jgi:hypothetical protein
MTALYNTVGNDVTKFTEDAIAQLETLAQNAPALQSQILTMIKTLRSNDEAIRTGKKDNGNISIFGVDFDKAQVRSALTSAFSDFLNSIPEIINGTKSVGQAFRDMARQVIGAMIQIMIQRFAVHLVDMLIGKAASGGEVQQKATGGQITKYAVGGGTINGKMIREYAFQGIKLLGGKIAGSGSDTSDNQLVAVSPSEWVIQGKSSRKYGTKFMKAVNDGTININDANALVNKYATGGIIKSLSANVNNQFMPSNNKVVNVKEAVKPLQQSDTQSTASNSNGLTIVNVTDPKMVPNYLNSSDGNKTFINMVNNNKSTIKRLINAV